MQAIEHSFCYDDVMILATVSSLVTEFVYQILLVRFKLSNQQILLVMLKLNSRRLHHNVERDILSLLARRVFLISYEAEVIPVLTC